MGIESGGGRDPKKEGHITRKEIEAIKAEIAAEKAAEAAEKAAAPTETIDLTKLRETAQGIEERAEAGGAAFYQIGSEGPRLPTEHDLRAGELRRAEEAKKKAGTIADAQANAPKPASQKPKTSNPNAPYYTDPSPTQFFNVEQMDAEAKRVPTFWENVKGLFGRK